MSKKFLYIVLVLILAACTQKAVPRTNDVPKSEYLQLPVSQFKSVDEAYETYKSGIMKIMADIPDSITDRADPLHRLSMYKDLYIKMGWSHIKSDNAIFSLTAGNRSACWVSFLDLDHPALKTRGNTLNAKVNKNGLVFIVIRPDKISDKWAGVFLLHELSHAKEYMDIGHSDREKTELLAYELEKIAYNHITENLFDRVLDEVINIHNISYEGMLSQLDKKEVKHFSPVLHEIDEKMSEEFGQSIAEMEMRHGFYLMSIVLRLSEKNMDDTETKARKMNSIIEKVSLF
jgi:hypothetical protein